MDYIMGLGIAQGFNFVETCRGDGCNGCDGKIDSTKMTVAIVATVAG